MSLIRSNRANPIYALMRGTSSAVGANTTAMIPFADTFISSNGINRVSATRVSVDEAGFYEIVIPIEVRVSHASGFIIDSIQMGVNGTWTNLTTSPATNTANGFLGNYSIIVSLAAGAYFELRSVTGAGPTAHTVYCNVGAGAANLSTWIFPLYNMKKL